jgi:hypothetical protein
MRNGTRGFEAILSGQRAWVHTEVRNRSRESYDLRVFRLTVVLVFLRVNGRVKSGPGLCVEA